MSAYGAAANTKDVGNMHISVGCPQICIHTLRIIIKAVFIKTHFIFKIEPSAIKVYIHFQDTRYQLTNLSFSGNKGQYWVLGECVIENLDPSWFFRASVPGGVRADLRSKG